MKIKSSLPTGAKMDFIDYIRSLQKKNDSSSKEVEIKKSSPFSVMSYLWNKSHTWEELTEEEQEKFNIISQQYIYKAFSEIPEWIPLMEAISTLPLDSGQIYKILYASIPRSSSPYYFSKVNRVTDKVDDLLVKAVMLEYFYTREKALDYIKDLDPEEVKYLYKRWKPYIEESE